MSTKFTAILWHSNQNLSETSLFGRPLWHWTLEAVRGLRPARILELSSTKRPAATNGVEPINFRQLKTELARLDGKVLILSAEIPCIQPRTLKRLLALSSPRSRCLACDGDESAAGIAVCGMGRDLSSALSGLDEVGFGSLARSLQPEPVEPTRPDELVQVRTLHDWSRAAQILRLRKCEKLLASGVSIDDPSAVRIDPQARVGKGTRIHEWVVIEGTSRIGTDCEIGNFTHIVDSVLGSRTIVLDHCFLRSSRVGKEAQIGPFAHLRPDSVIGTRAKVGNFVELKKTTLGRESKAPHLTYLGDATIGRGVNVGAGTITCNYDGQAKHPTIIDDGAFIGSDVQLVAPVRVGRGAYVAAGSCIVEDVPTQSLALARSRQVNKVGWARRRNKKRD